MKRFAKNRALNDESISQGAVATASSLWRSPTKEKGAATVAYTNPFNFCVVLRYLRKKVIRIIVFAIFSLLQSSTYYLEFLKLTTSLKTPSMNLR